jgi:hypothetical protein
MDDKRTARASVIAMAGIPPRRIDAPLDELDSLFELHTYTPPDQACLALQGVIDAAEKFGTTERWKEKFNERVLALPSGLRSAIFEYQGYRNGKQLAAELPPETVLERAQAVTGAYPARAMKAPS